MLDYRGIMLKYYEAGSPLFRTLWIHSECVARKALECLDRRGIDADRDFVREAAMLHDIGIHLLHRRRALHPPRDAWGGNAAE